MYKKKYIKKQSINSQIIELGIYTGMYIILSAYNNYQLQKKAARRDIKNFPDILKNINNKNGIPKDLVEYMIIPYAFSDSVE